MPHPSDEELVAFRDSELAEPRHNEISAHVKACESCQERLTRIEEDLRRFRQQDPATYSVDVIPPSERLAELERSLRVWSSVHVRGSGEPSMPRTFPPADLAAALRKRLDAEAIVETLAIIRAAGSDRERLSMTVAEFLRARLEQSEATELTKRILEAWDRSRTPRRENSTP